ncbi:hypothetical protein EJB05_51649, partial [Eragrostis curvula]
MNRGDLVVISKSGRACHSNLAVDCPISGESLPDSSRLRLAGIEVFPTRCPSCCRGRLTGELRLSVLLVVNLLVPEVNITSVKLEHQRVHLAVDHPDLTSSPNLRHPPPLVAEHPPVIFSSSRSSSVNDLTETTPEPLDFQLPEEQTQEVQEEQPPQDTDPADPVSYAPEPGKPRCGLGYVRTC